MMRRARQPTAAGLNASGTRTGGGSGVGSAATRAHILCTQADLSIFTAVQSYSTASTLAALLAHLILPTSSKGVVGQNIAANRSSGVYGYAEGLFARVCPLLAGRRPASAPASASAHVP